MSKNSIFIFGAETIVLIILACFSAYLGLYSKNADDKNDTTNTYSYYIFPNDTTSYLGTPERDLYEFLLFYKVKYPDVAYAIAIQETGWFKSELCVKYHNLFGLYNSSKKEYYHFNNWHESILAYKRYIEDKYDEKEGYYKFLENLPYSQDKKYINKLKKIEKLIISED